LAAAAAVSRTSSTALFGAASARGARPGGGGPPSEFDTGGIAPLDLDLSVAMTVSLEEAVTGVRNASGCRPARNSMSKIPPESRRVSRSG
jgi:hypothetical protein